MADDTSTRLAANLKRLREGRGLSQASLSEESGVPRPTIAHLESGQANPTLSVVLRVAQALGVSVDALVDSGEVGIRVVGPRALNTKKTAKVKRVQLVEPATLREVEVERIVVKEGGRFRLVSESGELSVLLCARGEFLLEGGGQVVVFPEENIAFLRVDCEVSSALGGELYRVTGRAVVNSA